MNDKKVLSEDEINQYNKFISLWNDSLENIKTKTNIEKISEKIWSIFFELLNKNRLKFMNEISEEEINLLNENNIKSWLKSHATIRYSLTLKYLYKRYHESPDLSYEYFLWKMTKFYFKQNAMKFDENMKTLFMNFHSK